MLAQTRYAWMNLNHAIAMQVGGAGRQAVAGDDMRFRAVNGIDEGELQGRFRVMMRSHARDRYDQSTERGDQTGGSNQPDNLSYGCVALSIQDFTWRNQEGQRNRL